jgi:L-tyrosine peroxygenase
VTPAASWVLSDLPAGGRWDFGGFAYGLEPLVLPSAGHPEAAGGDPETAAAAAAYAEICWRIRSVGERGWLMPEVERCGAPEELFWFRWITGHQACFVIWQLIAQILDDVNSRRRTPQEALEPVCRYVDGYSAMMLYTGSCPRDLYGTLIRPSMRLRHRAFSGSWAPDYWPIRDLFRRRKQSLIWAADTGDLQDAMTLLSLVHDGVAARLVTSGTSLLDEASVRGPGHRTAAMIYDTYFMTLRAPVPRHDVVGQLLRRLVAIAQDIAVNSLYADGDGDDDGRPAELRTAEAVKCENSLGEIMFQVARRACGPAPWPAIAMPRPEVLSNTAAEM